MTAAGAEEAAEISTGITFNANGKSDNFGDMQDDDFRTYYPMKEKNGWLEIHSEEPVRGVYIMLFEKITVPLSYDVQVKNGAGEWKTVAQGGQYLVNWHLLEEAVTELRISETSKERIRIAELRLFSEGEKPPAVQPAGPKTASSVPGNKRRPRRPRPQSG